MGRSERDAAIGSRKEAKARARERAREEGRPIYVLRYLDRDKLYTASMHAELTLSPAEMHGYYTPQGEWVPRVVMDLDDAITLLRAYNQHGAADLIAEARGDKNGNGNGT